MITLITGMPGDGKTLYALNFLKAKAEKEKRQVYYSGVRDLRVPCEIPWLEFGREGSADKPWETDASEWHKLPQGSIILIDECQRLFRPRGQGSVVPEYVAALETHRHKGFDIVLVTQHPMLVDSNVRRLVGQHFHSKRKFGAPAATIHEWNQVRERPDQNRGESIRHEFIYPKNSYLWYKSAEIHTHKVRIPFRFWFLLAVPVLFAGLVYGAVHWFAARQDGAASRIEGAAGVVSGRGNSGAGPVGRGAAGSGATRGRAALSTAEFVQTYDERIAGLAYTAPRYDEITRPVNAPFPAACVASSNRCQCYTDQATRLPMPEDLCRQIVASGFFQEWQVQRREAPSGTRQRDAGADPVKDPALPVGGVYGKPDPLPAEQMGDPAAGSVNRAGGTRRPGRSAAGNPANP